MLKLFVLALIAAPLWAGSLWLWPFGRCRGCKGTGRNIGSTGRRFGTHRRCRGSGKRVRFGARLLRRSLRRRRENG